MGLEIDEEKLLAKLKKIEKVRIRGPYRKSSPVPEFRIKESVSQPSVPATPGRRWGILVGGGDHVRLHRTLLSYGISPIPATVYGQGESRAAAFVSGMDDRRAVDIAIHYGLPAAITPQGIYIIEGDETVFYRLIKIQPGRVSLPNSVVVEIEGLGTFTLSFERFPL